MSKFYYLARKHLEHVPSMLGTPISLFCKSLKFLYSDTDAEDPQICHYFFHPNFTAVKVDSLKYEQAQSDLILAAAAVSFHTLTHG